jgi:predicted small lipoprotein YifL
MKKYNFAMLNASSRILVIATLAVLAGCGQKGDLFLPTDAAAANRATLPQTLRPGGSTPTAPAPAGSSVVPGASGTGTASPVRPQ